MNKSKAAFEFSAKKLGKEKLYLDIHLCRSSIRQRYAKEMEPPTDAAASSLS
jgi:hypothetical protein